MIKRYIFIILLFASVFGLAQTDTIKNQLVPFKNQLSLDIEGAGINLSYKGKIAKRFFIGYSIGGGMLYRFELNGNGSGTSIDYFRQKIFLDIQITKRFHIYEAVVHSYGLFFVPDGSDLNLEHAFGIETGFFYQISQKLEIGFEPSVIYTERTFSIGIPLVTLRIPLVKWLKNH